MLQLLALFKWKNVCIYKKHYPRMLFKPHVKSFVSRCCWAPCLQFIWNYITFIFFSIIFLFVSLSKFKRVSEHLQTSVSVGGAKCYSGASTTPTCVGGRSSVPKHASYTHTCTYACTHTHTDHTNSCMNT